MAEGIQIQGGSVVGHAHVASGKSNQDAFAWARSLEDGHLVAVVADGCGSAPHSGVGAQLGARLLVQLVLDALREGLAEEVALMVAHERLVVELRHLAEAMSGAPQGTTEFARVVLEHFLFTVVGVVVDGRAGLVTPFSLGDGLLVLNGEPHVLGPFANNEPPYLGYQLVDGNRRPFRRHASLRIEALRSMLLGTDGAVDLMNAEHVTADRSSSPVGRLGCVGPLRQFWEEERYFKNPDMVRRRLAVVSKLKGPRGSLLADDTTLVVLRRSGAVAADGKGGLSW